MGIKTTLEGLGFVGATVASLLGGGDAEAQVSSSLNEDRGITSCELGPDGPEITKDGETRHLSDAIVTEDQLLADDGSVGATPICDRTDTDVTPSLKTEFITPAENHICVQLEDGSIQAYLPDGEEFDETVKILSTEFSNIVSETGIIGNCILETEQGLQDAPIFTSKAVSLDM